MSLKELMAEDNLPNILKRLAYKSLDDMYAAIGYGGVTSLKLIGRLREDIQRILKMHQEDRAAEEPGATASPSTGRIAPMLTPPGASPRRRAAGSRYPGTIAPGRITPLPWRWWPRTG